MYSSRHNEMYMVPCIIVNYFTKYTGSSINIFMVNINRITIIQFNFKELGTY